MKKIVKSGISILLCAVMLFGTAPLSGFKDIHLPKGILSGTFDTIVGWFDGLQLKLSASALETSGQCGANVYWTFDELTGTLTISGEGPTKDYTSISSPFYNDLRIKNILILNGITSIGDYMFCGCSDANTVTIPDSVISIGYSSFYNCTGPTSISIPDSVTNIENYAFYNVNNVAYSQNMTVNNSPWKAKTANGFVDGYLVYKNSSKQTLCGCSSVASGTITIPNSVISIGNNAFANCIYLTNVIIPNSVTSMGYYAFYNCNGLTEITIPDSIKRIEKYSFSNCYRLTTISLPNVLSYIGDDAFQNCIELKSLSIPESVKTISYGAFKGCTGLKNIILPESVETISDNAFQNCIELKSLSIPESVKTISCDAFKGCTGLKNIILPESVKTIGEDAFLNCNSITSVFYNGTPSQWCNIDFGTRGSYPHYYADYLYFNRETPSSIVLSDDVSVIPQYAFLNCKYIKSITISENTTDIGSMAFSGCSELADVIIPNTMISIGPFSFEDCVNIKSITIPNSVKNIGKGSFSGCKGLLHAVIGENVEELGDYAFYECCELSDFTLKNSVTNIGAYAFSDCASLTNVTLPDSIVEIGEYAFSQCRSLAKINIPNGVTSINYSTFSGCESLAEISIPNNVTTIEGYAFYYCRSLKKISIGHNIINVSYGAFGNCDNLSFIDFYGNPDEWVEFLLNASKKSASPKKEKCSVNIIKDGKIITDIVITSEIKEIPHYAFSSCENIVSIILPNTVTDIGVCAFSGCTQLANVVIPDTVTNIGGLAFAYCSNLTSITIPDKVSEIQGYTFYDCAKLTRINIGKGVTSIEGYAFNGCVKMKELLMPCSAKISDSFVFKGCNNIEKITLTSGYGYMQNFDTWSGTFNENLCYEFTPWFYSRNTLKKIIIEDGIKSIGENAFRECTSISITIPKSVTSIGTNAFYGVNNIIYSDNWYNNVMNRQGSPWGAKAVDAYVEDGLYFYDSSKELLLGCSSEKDGDIYIPDSVEEVGENCFFGCNNITSINFSSPVYFADTAFSGCENLQSVIAPDNSDSLGVVYTKPVSDREFHLDSVSESNISIEHDTGILFCDRNAYGEYTVPSGITHICENAFANCENVNVIIPDTINLKSIGANAFFNSKDYNDNSKWGNDVLTIGGYLVASKTSISGVLTLVDSIKGIADRAFERCSDMTGFRCGNKIRFLGNKAFGGCSALLKNNIQLSSSLVYVGEDLFDISSEQATLKETEYFDNVLVSVSPDVESFTIKDGTTVIAAGAFSGCSKLKSIIIPNGITAIDKNTFKGCVNLESVTLNSNINEIGDNAFADCISLTNITIPASVYEIGHLAFYGCIRMQSFNVADENEKYKADGGVLTSKSGNTIIQYPAAKSAKNYTISDNTYVSDLAFYRCRNLEKVTIGCNIEYGNRNPFASCSAGFYYDDENADVLFGDTGCTVLKSVSANVSGKFTIPDTVTEIGNDAFRNCASITDIDFSEAYNLSIINDFAFYGCTGLTSVVIPNTVMIIGNSAFKNCLNLQKVIFESNTVTGNYTLYSIGDYAFCNCSCNEKYGICNYDILNAEDLKISKTSFYNYDNFESFKKPFNSFIGYHNQNVIYGVVQGLNNLDCYINDSTISTYSDTKTVGTGSVIAVTNALDSSGIEESSVYYRVTLFGDVNGDGWYDGMDAILVNCLANGMLTRGQVGEAKYMAADCNHDGIIDSADVALLEQAGLILASVDQTKSGEELMSDAAYIEYLSLIDQNPEEETSAEENTTDAASTEKTVDEGFNQSLLQKVIAFITYVFKMIKSFIIKQA